MLSLAAACHPRRLLHPAARVAGVNNGCGGGRLCSDFVHISPVSERFYRSYSIYLAISSLHRVNLFLFHNLQLLAASISCSSSLFRAHQPYFATGQSISLPIEVITYSNFCVALHSHLPIVIFVGFCEISIIMMSLCQTETSTGFCAFPNILSNFSVCYLLVKYESVCSTYYVVLVQFVLLVMNCESGWTQDNLSIISS